MRRMMMLGAMLALGLAACAPAPAPSPAPAPHVHVTTGPAITAPLRNTNGDERMILVAYQTADAILGAVDLLVDTGKIKPGSPQALRVASALKTAKAALYAAALAQRAGNATNYRDAMDDAEAALAAAGTALKEIRR